MTRKVREGGGYVEFRGGVWQVQVWKRNTPSGEARRIWLKMPGIGADEEAVARRRAPVLVKRYHEVGAVPLERAETVGEWFARYFPWRADKGLSRIDIAQGQFEKWAQDIIGDLPMVDGCVKPEHLKAVVAKLDAAVVAEELKWKTADNIWSILSKAFKDACGCKEESLCVLSLNPAMGVPRPDRGNRTSKQYLWPDEFLQLISCEAIPLSRRRLYVFAAYGYMRLGEIAAMKWEDVDLDHRLMVVHETRVRRNKRHDIKSKTKATKTGIDRRVPIEPALMPLLEVMYAERGDDVLVFPGLPTTKLENGKMAEQLRKDLETAGLMRAALTQKSKTRKWMTFHDLRATACTWAAVRGDSPLKIMARSGHETYEVMLQYVREAEVVREGFGDPFPPLPASVLGVLAAASPGQSSGSNGQAIPVGESVTSCPIAQIAAPLANAPRTPQTPQKSPKNTDKMVEAPGIEFPAENRVTPRTATKSHEVPPPEAPQRDDWRGPLAEAVKLAAAAGQWDIVAQLSRQLMDDEQRPAVPSSERSLRAIKGGRS